MSECTLCKQLEENINLFEKFVAKDFLFEGNECQICKNSDTGKCGLDEFGICSFKFDVKKAKEILKNG
jgi:hypothetical protein